MVDLRELDRFGSQDAGIRAGGVGLELEDVLELVTVVDSPASVADAKAASVEEPRGTQPSGSLAPRQVDELLLDQEFDPTDEPRVEAGSVAKPYILVSLPGSSQPAAPDIAGDRKLRTVAIKAPIASEARPVLIELLDQARMLALAASISEGRTRGALYDAIGRAYDVALAAERTPEELAQLLLSAKIAVRQKVPNMGIAKLVFGSDYDKTRLSEYATVLSHAQRLKLEPGALARFLSNAHGGLKGVVAEERQLRRNETGVDKPARTGPSEALARRLRGMPVRPMGAVSGEGDEFMLVLARRLPDGTAALIGEVPRDIPLLERAARRLANSQD